MKKIYIFIFTLFTLLACNIDSLEKDKTPLAKVGGEVLYEEDLEDLYYGDENREALIAEYVEEWCARKLLYELALNNIYNSKEIDDMVEDYKQSMYIYMYKKQYADANLEEPSEQTVKEFYNDNIAQFIQDEKLLKGLYVMFPKDHKEGRKIKQILRNYKEKDIEVIEKFSLRSDVKYAYFLKDWASVESEAIDMPASFNADKISNNKSYYEHTEGEYTYVLHIDSVLEVGEIAPFEVCKQKATDMLFSKMKMDYIQNMDQSIYKEALENKEVIIFK